MGKSYVEIMLEREKEYDAVVLDFIQSTKMSHDMKEMLKRTPASYVRSPILKLGQVDGVEPVIPSFEEFMRRTHESRCSPPLSFMKATYDFEHRGKKGYGSISLNKHDAGWRREGRQAFRVSFGFETLRGQPSDRKPEAATEKLAEAVKKWKNEIDSDIARENRRLDSLSRMEAVFHEHPEFMVERHYTSQIAVFPTISCDKYSRRQIVFSSPEEDIVKLKEFKGNITEDQLRRISEIFFEEEIQLGKSLKSP